MAKKRQTKPAAAAAATATADPAVRPSRSHATAGGVGPMDPVLLERLVRLMSDHDLSAIDLRDGQQRVSLKRGPQQVAYAELARSAPVSRMPEPVEAPTSQRQARGTEVPPSAAPDADAGLVPIKSPMVGTFYAAPSPDAKPFVAVGSTVDEETDVCVIEAMKVFNNIKAETRGTVAKVMVTNGATVEFGTVLFLVRPG